MMSMEWDHDQMKTHLFMSVIFHPGACMHFSMPRLAPGMLWERFYSHQKDCMHTNLFTLLEDFIPEGRSTPFHLLFQSERSIYTNMV